MAWVVSYATIAAHLALSHVLRRRLSGQVRAPLLRDCLLELVAAGEMCAVALECGIVAETLGLVAFSVTIFLLIEWRQRSWGRTSACAYTLLERWVEGSGAPPLHTVLLIVCQVVGALAASRVARLVWALELSTSHAGRGQLQCVADLRVSVLWGVLVEGGFTCAIGLLVRALTELKPRFSSAICSFSITTMVMLALTMTGGYFNPVLATGLRWGCQGHTNTEHIVVYWAGSILGALLSLRLWTVPSVRSSLVGPFKYKSA